MSFTINWFRKKRQFLPPAQPPAPAPSNVTATGATLSWTQQASATLYLLEQSIDQIAWTEAATTTQLFYDATGLTQSSLYYFRLSAGNARGGYSPPSEVSIVTLDDLTPPATPTSAPTETNHGTTTITVAWTAVATATGYELHRATSSGGVYTKVRDANVLSFADSGLTAATAYFYKYLAKNADGASGFSPILTVTTDGAPVTPPTPAQPTASGITASSVQITWVNPGGATDYTLQRRQTAPTTTSFVTIYSGQSLTFLNIGLTASATYEYKVSATNSSGTSAYSPVRIITTGSVGGTNVQPHSALLLRERSGVVGHPNFGTGTVYNVNWVDDQIRLVDEIGFTYIRGPLGNNPELYAAQLRARNMKWEIPCMEEGDPLPTQQSLATTRANVRYIRENLADICLSVDGINEPDHNRSGATTVANWAEITANHQEVMWQEARWNLTSVNGPIGSSPTAGSVPNPLRNVMVLGPALHDVETENSYAANPPPAGWASIGGQRHWHQLEDQGILAWQTHANIHSYNGGGAPEKSKMDERIGYMESAYGAGYDLFVSEWGYHNAIQTTAGHRPITEAGEGVYMVRGYLQNLCPMTPGGTDRHLSGLTKYEIFDDVDPDPKNEHEKNFGAIGYSPSGGPNNPSTWRLKGGVIPFKAFMTQLREPASTLPYTPNRVFLDVSSTVSGAAIHWVCTATKAQSNAGTATAWIWRELDVWNPATRVTISVPTVATTVTDRVGARSFQIGAAPVGVDLR